MQEHAVVVVGAGPTGMVLAAELALVGTDVAVVERRATPTLESSRAGGLHARTLEVLDQRGVAGRFLDEGQVMQIQSFAGIALDISDLATRHPYGLALWQRDIEHILAGWIEELGVTVLREREVVALDAGDDGAAVTLSDGTVLQAGYLVGCDGGRSTVRRALGIDFEGLDATVSWMIAEADTDEPPVLGVRPEGGGIGPLDRSGRPGGPYGIVLKERELHHGGEPSVAELRAALTDAYGTDFGVRPPTYLSRFTDVSRQAAEYRRGRILLAGDAAHVHPPQGGQGLNTGVQDAVNLGWKLGLVASGAAPDSLLDSYHAERHPVGARVLRTARAQVALSEPTDGVAAVREVLGEVLATDEARRLLAGELSGLGIRYALGEGHPLVGWRVPDMDLETGGGSTRVHALLHDARPLVLVLDESSGPVPADRLPPVLRVVAATAAGPWRLPLGDEVPSPGAVLVRPDGHVAWAGEIGDHALEEAARRWFGSAQRGS